jgi:hypothetical protein
MYPDLAEHITTVVALLSLFAGVAAMGAWHSWKRMENKVDKAVEALQDIAKILCDKVDWETFNYHKHNGDGSMIHGNK